MTLLAILTVVGCLGIFYYVLLAMEMSESECDASDEPWLDWDGVEPEELS